MKLSKYTIAKNCSDLSDVRTGLNEIRKYLDDCYDKKIIPKPTAYIRYNELFKKRDKLMKSE